MRRLAIILLLCSPLFGQYVGHIDIAAAPPTGVCAPGNTVVDTVDGTIYVCPIGATWGAATIAGANLASPGPIGGTTPGAIHGTTIDATGGITALSDGVHAGIDSLIGNTTAPSIPSNSFGFLGPNSASFTSWFIQASSTAPTAGCIMRLGVPSSSISAMLCDATANVDATNGDLTINGINAFHGNLTLNAPSGSPNLELNVGGTTNVRWSSNGNGIMQFDTGGDGFSRMAFGFDEAAQNALCRMGASEMAIGQGGAQCTTLNYLKTAQLKAVTAADVTCGTGGTISSCTTATTITGLSFTLPLIAQTWSVDCNLIVGQATAATANGWYFQTATNGATNSSGAYMMNTAAAVIASGATTGQGSTTTAFQIGGNWTLGATGTKMPVHLWGTIEGASASGTVLNIQVLAPTVGDLLTIYRGSSCRVF